MTGGAEATVEGDKEGSVEVDGSVEEEEDDDGAVLLFELFVCSSVVFV